MGRRAVTAVAIAAISIAMLAGCQASVPGSFTRADAQGLTRRWTTQAANSVGSPAPASLTKADGYESCRTDTGFLTTTFQWRTITNVSVPKARQAAATAAIQSSFHSADWTVSHSRGLLTLVGPNGEERMGLVTVQTAGPSALAVTVISPCYQ